MSIKPMIKGLAMGATIGAVWYVVSNSSASQKRRLKKDTGKAVKAMGSVVEEFSSMIS